MKLENTITEPVKLPLRQASFDDTKPKTTDVDSDAEQSEDDNVTISMAGLKKLKEESEDPKDKLPSHIKEMIKAIERLIEMIEAAEEALTKAKKADYPDDDTKRDVLEMHQSQINSLEFARNDAINGLMEAMKEAGISEPGIIIELMR